MRSDRRPRRPMGRGRPGRRGAAARGACQRGGDPAPSWTDGLPGTRSPSRSGSPAPCRAPRPARSSRSCCARRTAVLVRESTAPSGGHPRTPDGPGTPRCPSGPRDSVASAAAEPPGPCRLRRYAKVTACGNTSSWACPAAGRARRPATRRGPGPGAHQRRRHLPLERPAPHQDGRPGTADHGGRGTGRRRPGRVGDRGAARPARLELRLRHRRVPAQRPAGRVLPGELRHRRGHPPGPARLRGAPPGAGAAAVRRLRGGLQPDPEPPEHRGRLRRVRGQPDHPRGRHRGSPGRAAARVPREDRPGARPVPAQGVRGGHRRDAEPGRDPAGDPRQAWAAAVQEPRTGRRLPPRWGRRGEAIAPGEPPCGC